MCRGGLGRTVVDPFRKSLIARCRVCELCERVRFQQRIHNVHLSTNLPLKRADTALRIDALKKMPHVPQDGGDGARSTITAISVRRSATLEAPMVATAAAIPRKLILTCIRRHIVKPTAKLEIN